MADGRIKNVRRIYGRYLPHGLMTVSLAFPWAGGTPVNSTP